MDDMDDMDDIDIIEAAIRIRLAIEQAANEVLYDLQCRLGITSGEYSPDVAIHLQEHLSTLVKDYYDILNDQKLHVIK